MSALPIDLAEDSLSVRPGELSDRAALDFLYGRIDYERAPPVGDAGGAFKLDRMRELLARLGDPQLQIPCVHVAGSKGKGSTAAMLASVLTAAGHRTGLFTSPHIHRFEERVQIDGVLLAREHLVRHVERLRPLALDMDSLPCGGPTFFELTTALGWLEFLEQRVDVAVLEVGLGGRLDATNLCRPLACLITSISRDHTRLLGDTHEAIAAEKAGIVKPDVPLLTAVDESGPLRVIRGICQERGAPCYVLGEDIHLRNLHRIDDEDRAASLPFYGLDVRTPWRLHREIDVPLPGLHQTRNVALVLTAADLLDETTQFSLPEPALRHGLLSVRWPLRIEVVGHDPLLILDAAHNVASIAALLETLRGVRAARRIGIFGTSRDKEAAVMLRQLAPEFDELILTQFLSNPRAIRVADLHRIATRELSRPCRTAETPAEALALARELATPRDLICLTGSFFLAAEVRELVVTGR
jgi:dihydrofolate synthase/folylpolyglutamate synthase